MSAAFDEHLYAALDSIQCQHSLRMILNHGKCRSVTSQMGHTENVSP